MYHASPKVFHKRFKTWLVELLCFLNRKGGWDACIGEAAYIDHHYEQSCLDASNTMEGCPALSGRSWSFEGLVQPQFIIMYLWTNDEPLRTLPLKGLKRDETAGRAEEGRWGREMKVFFLYERSVSLRCQFA